MSDTSSAVALRDAGHLEPARRHAPVLDFAGGTLQDKWQMADMLSRSELVPKDFKGKPGNILLAADIGASVGLSVAQALQNIAVINGRPTLWGDGMLGVVLRSPLCEWFREVEIGRCVNCKKSVFRDPGDRDRPPAWIHDGTMAMECNDGKAVAEPDLTDDSYGYRATAKRRGNPDIIINEFTFGNAKTAGLLLKDGPWKTYGPRRMCRMRARSWTFRDGFADVLKGLSMREEIVDVPEEVRASIVNAPTRTDALRAALEANAAVAKAAMAQRNAEIPSADEAADRTHVIVDQARGIAVPVEEQLQAALDNAGAADPDFAKMKAADLRDFIKTQAQVFNVKPWYVSDIERNTPEGRLVRGNVVAVLRAIRERSLRDQLGIPPPRPADQSEKDVERSETIEAESSDSDVAGNMPTPVEPSPETGREPSKSQAPAADEKADEPPFESMSSQELLDYVEDVAFNAKISSQRLVLIIRVHTDGAAITADTIPAILADIRKSAAAS